MIWIIQCLCPQRHCIYAIAYDPQDIAHDVILAGFQQLTAEWVTKKIITPWCGICESRLWHFEQKPTIYQTMAEARPVLEALELENRISRMQIDERRAAKN